MILAMLPLIAAVPVSLLVGAIILIDWVHS